MESGGKWTSSAPACEVVISYSLGTIELSSKWPVQALLLKWLNGKLTIFIGSCYPVCHKKWNVEWINIVWKWSLLLKSSMITFLLSLVTFGRDYITN